MSTDTRYVEQFEAMWLVNAMSRTQKSFAGVPWYSWVAILIFSLGLIIFSRLSPTTGWEWAYLIFAVIGATAATLSLLALAVRRSRERNAGRNGQ